MNKIKLHDTVALTENITMNQFMTDKKIVIPRGQVGTIVEVYSEEKAFEVEFSDSNGQTYALVSLRAEQLILLYYDTSNLVLI
ncbi:DUF4926 domain-containing protein [Geminocystis herdmanii]|uniref:DUF4926 domain-containing protein n=1 Tax=Geminocystis herdmanii TaxID=669359 RepID=UPI00034DAE11|nr:DUF4926 domain-containing protein [Geminocystis herdmanii]